MHAVLVLETGRRRRRDRAAGQRGARRSPEDPPRAGLARARAAAHRRHAQAEASRRARLGRLRAARRASWQRAPIAWPRCLRSTPGRDDLPPNTTIEELGLSSLDRVELMVALEDAFQTPIDEGKFAEARDIGSAARPARAGAGRRDAAGRAGRVSRRGIDRGPPARSAAPACRPGFCRSRACSRGCASKAASTFRASKVPVIFAANHQSHMDTPVIMAALPARWRYRVAPAMAKEFFKAHFFPAEHGRLGLVHELAELLSRGAVLQRLSAAAARSRRAADAALHRRRPRGRLLGPDLSGGEADRHRRDRALPSGHRHDCVAPERAGRARPDRRARSGAASHVADGDARAASGSPSARRCTSTGDDYESLAKQVEDAVEGCDS